MQIYNLEGTFNARDLGYTPTTNGRYINYQKFICSDAPHKVSSDVKNFLIDKNIKNIIDLKNETIVDRNSNVFAGDDKCSKVLPSGFCALKSSYCQRLYHGKQEKNEKVIKIVKFRVQKWKVDFKM